MLPSKWGKIKKTYKIVAGLAEFLSFIIMLAILFSGNLIALNSQNLTIYWDSVSQTLEESY